MRNSPVVVQRWRVIDAPADRVWSLLSSPEAWSLRPASFAFDVHPPGAGRLRVAIVVRRNGPHCLLYEVSEDAAGQAMSLTALPSGQLHLRLSAQPDDHGTRAIIAATILPARRAVRARNQAYWQAHIDRWLTNLEAVIQNTRPWPGAALDPRLNAACRSREPLASPAVVSVSTLINAPAPEVWDAVHAPGSLVQADPRHFVCAGQVRGTPDRQLGEMQYYVRRDDHGRLSVSAVIVTEINGQHSTLTASVAPFRVDTLHEVNSTPQGTKLTLTCRWPAKHKRLRSQIAHELELNLARYKMLTENAGRDPSPVGPGNPLADDA